MRVECEGFHEFVVTHLTCWSLWGYACFITFQIMLHLTEVLKTYNFYNAKLYSVFTIGSPEGLASSRKKLYLYCTSILLVSIHPLLGICLLLHTPLLSCAWQVVWSWGWWSALKPSTVSRMLLSHSLSPFFDIYSCQMENSQSSSDPLNFLA